MERKFAACQANGPMTVRFPYSANPSDVTGKRLELKKVFPLPSGVIQETTRDPAFARGILATLSMEMNDFMMSKGPWVCSPNPKCRRPAKHFVCQPHSYLHLQEPMIVDHTPVPVCGDLKCDTMAKQGLQKLVSDIARDNR